MRADLVPPDADLIQEVASRLEESGVPLPEALVVFPGKRPAHFLRKRLAAGRTGGFIPPEILSMDGLIHSVFDRRTAGALPAMEDIDAVAILHAIQLSAKHPIGGTGFMSLDAFFPLGLKIYQDLEELLIEGVAPERVVEVQPLIEAGVPPKNRERLLELGRFYREFYPEAQKRGLSTRASRYRAVSESITREDLGSFNLVILAGFFALTAAEKNLFARVSWPETLFVFQEGRGMRERLDAYGIKVSARKGGGARRNDAAAPSPRVTFTKSPDTHGQVFAIDATLAAAEENTALVLPAPETLFPLLRHFLARFPEESYNISLGYPLERTPLYGFFENLMALIGSMDGDRLYIPDYLAFILHPYAKNIRLRSSAEATRVLFHTLEDSLASSRTRLFASLEEIESGEKVFQDAAKAVSGEEGGTTAAELSAHLRQIHEKTIRGFRSFGSVREFASRCVALIRWIHESSTAPSHPYFSPFAEEFIRALDAISRSLMAEKSFRAAAGYFALFRRFLRTRYHPFPGTPLRGLQVLGALETRGLKFERIYVLDANEGVLPASAADDSLLAFSVRKALDLPTYRDGDEIAAYHFELLARGAKELHLLWVESGEKEKSRFVERLLWEKQRAENTLDASRCITPIHYAVSLQEKAPAPIEKTEAVVEHLRSRSYSATALDAYLKCPLSFYYRYVLGLGKREEVSGEIEPAEIGLFVHETLFRYFAPRKGRELQPSDADRKAMEEIVERLFAERYGDADSGALRLLRNQIRSHLGDFMECYLGPLVRDHKVILERLEHHAKAELAGFSLNGRIDAVEARDGTRWVIDYKTGSNPISHKIRFDRLELEDRESWAKAVPTLQLPLYLLLEKEAKNGMFLLLGRSAMNAGIELPLFKNEAEAEREMPRLEAVMGGLLREIVSVDVPFAPTGESAGVCPYCDFKTMCGAGRHGGRAA